MSRRTVHYRGAVLAAIVLSAVGLANASGVLIVAATLPLGYVGYAALGPGVEPDAIGAHRRVRPHPAAPDDVVDVTLSVTNAGEHPLPDVRIVDGVPEDLAVVAGSPRTATSLEPGETVSIDYSLVARRGEYDFERPRGRVRDLAATRVEEFDLAVDGQEHLSCRLDADAPPLSTDGEGYVGRKRANEPGRGIEFHSTREYRPGDPADRIAWRHFAKRGELATIDYERRVSPTVVLVLDGRAAGSVAAGPARPTGLELAAYAATRSLATLLRQGADVGLAVLGRDGPGPDDLVYLPPDSGPAQRRRGLAHLREVTGDADAERPDQVERQCRTVADLAPAGTQVVVLSPMLEEGGVSVVDTFASLGLSTVLVSPDVVPTNTVSGQLAAVERRARLARCQAGGAAAIDWRRGTPLGLVLDRALAVDDRGGLSTAMAAGGVN